MSDNIYTCPHCDETFDSAQKLGGHLTKYLHKEKCETCDREMRPKFLQAHLDKRINCKYCNKLFCKKYPKQEFCSQSCRASFINIGRTQNKESRRKISNGLRKYYENNSSPKKNVKLEKKYFCPNCGKGYTDKKRFDYHMTQIPKRNCEYCGKPICDYSINHPKKYCSRDCYMKSRVPTESIKHGKSGYYKGIFCASTYELCYVIYNLDYNIKFERFPGKLTDGKLIYMPDFLLPDNTIIEIKGYHTSKVDDKCRLAESKGYKIKVLYGNDLKYAFDYVTETYGTKKFYELYDNYKPKYSYICDWCNSEFETDIKRRKDTKFCDRYCSSKHRNHKKYNTPAYQPD